MRRASGFTLIELLVTVAIVAVITLIAVPAYTDHVLKARRTEAKEALLAVAQSLEKCLADYGRYDGNGNCPIVSGAGLAPSVATTSGGHYLLGGFVGKNDYTLQAVPQGDQASDKCGTFSINARGIKSVNHDANGDGAINQQDAKLCWGS